MNMVYKRYRCYCYECSRRNIKSVLPETKRCKYKGSICHEYSKGNIGKSKKRINKRVRVYLFIYFPHHSDIHKIF